MCFSVSESVLKLDIRLAVNRLRKRFDTSVSDVWSLPSEVNLNNA